LLLYYIESVEDHEFRGVGGQQCEELSCGDGIRVPLRLSFEELLKAAFGVRSG
jgi:hypothetical protein